LVHTENGQSCAKVVPWFFLSLRLRFDQAPIKGMRSRTFDDDFLEHRKFHTKFGTAKFNDFLV